MARPNSQLVVVLHGCPSVGVTSRLSRYVEVTINSMGTTGSLRVGYASQPPPSDDAVPGEVSWPGSVAVDLSTGAVRKDGARLQSLVGAMAPRMARERGFLSGDVIGVGVAAGALVVSRNGCLYGDYFLAVPSQAHLTIHMARCDPHRRTAFSHAGSGAWHGIVCVGGVKLNL